MAASAIRGNRISNFLQGGGGLDNAVAFQIAMGAPFLDRHSVDALYILLRRDDVAAPLRGDEISYRISER
jgi:hypothetical protein